MARIQSLLSEDSGGDESGETQTPDHGEQLFGVAMVDGALDDEGVFGADQALVIEHSAKGFDFLCGPNR